MEAEVVFPSDIFNIESPPALVGGYLRHLQYGTPFHDIDLVCFTLASFASTVQYVEKYYDPVGCSVCGEYYFFKGEHLVQVQISENVKSIADFFAWTDFTVCSAIQVGGSLIAHPLYGSDTIGRYLRICKNYKTNCGLHARIEKYKALGYTYIGYET